MNVDQLQKQLNKTVKLRHPAQLRRIVGDLMPVDWEWRIMRIDKKESRVDLEAHSYCLTLRSDHIREFVSSSNEAFEGFLKLKVSVLIEGNKITVEPTMD